MDATLERLHDILKNGNYYTCADCGCQFPDILQTHSQQKFGQCISCGSENIFMSSPEGDTWIYGGLE